MRRRTTFAAWIALTLPVAGCAAPPPVAADITGHYRMQDGPDGWQELDVRPSGRVIWSKHFIGHHAWRNERHPGRWQVDGDRLLVHYDDGGVRKLSIRRWQRWNYILPRDDLAFFERYGPHVELCFAADAAPLRTSRWFPQEANDRAPPDPTR